MAGGHLHGSWRVLPAAGALILLGPLMALSACSGSAAPSAPSGPSGGAATGSSPAGTATQGAAGPVTPRSAAEKDAAAKAAARQVAAVKAAAAKFLANQARGEKLAGGAHPIAKAAAACGVQARYLVTAAGGSRVGPPDVPRRGDMWRVKATSPVKPGMIIYWPDGLSAVCR